MRHLLSATLAIVLLAACGTPEGDPNAPTSSDSLVDGRQNVVVSSGNRERRVLVYQPENLPDGPAPLIVVLHGGFGTGIGALELYDFEAAADAGGFIVATPDGTGTFQTWNAGDCCGAAARDNTPDVAFMRALVTQVSSLGDVDPDRVYATGMSNGAALAYRLACEAADVFAAVAPVAGSQSVETCNPSEPVSVAHLHGRLDTHVPATGGVGDEAVVAIEWPNIDEQFIAWHERNGCDAPETTRDDEVLCQRASGCNDDTVIELCVVEAMGHQWPPTDVRAVSDPTSDAISATDYVVEFLLSQRR